MRLWWGIAAVVLLSGACGSSDDAAPSAAPTEVPTEEPTEVPTEEPTEAATATDVPTEVPTEAPTEAAASGDDPRAIVETLAADELTGRDNGTPGSAAAQDYLTGLLEEFGEPQRQDFDGGTNLFAVIDGTDLADEYVIVGAHFDHLGVGDCRSASAADDICNGATDNAAGVAAAIEVARALVGAAEPPRRSVVIALWDREEDGLLGSEAYIAEPLVPLEQTIAYVNFDIQGANLSPALPT